MEIKKVKKNFESGGFILKNKIHRMYKERDILLEMD